MKITFFILAVILTLSGCGLFGGSDGTADVTVAEDVEAAPTVNSVQAVPAEPADASGAAGEAAGADPATAALPTAVTLPTAAPTPEPTVDRSQPTTYVVQSGDVLGLIAERFDVDISELRRVNNLDGNLIRVGQDLTIPAADGSAAPAADTTDTTDSASDSAAAPAPAVTTAPSAPVTCNSTATGHCIQPGESLLGIAVQYDVSVDALRAANPGVSGDLIRSGQVLNLPGSSPAPAAPATADPGPAAPVDPGPAAAPVDPAAPVATVGPASNADCEARNPEFPFFHASDGLCYANPIGGTPVPTAPAANAADIENADETTCDPGFFLWEDGLCYRIPGSTDAEPSVTATTEAVDDGSVSDGDGLIDEDFGDPPCREGYVVLVTTNKCWPDGNNQAPTTVTPVPDS